MNFTKPLFFLLPALLLPSLFGCSSEGEKKVSYLNFGMLYDEAADTGDRARFADHSISLDYGDLVKKIEGKESFLLLIYEANNTCTCWYRYEESLTRLLKKENLLIYGIDPSEFGGGKKTYGLKYKSGEENLVVFKDGEILDQRSTNGVDDTFVDYENVSTWLLEKIHPSDMLRIKKSQLDSLFEESATSSFLVYFGRESCGDCAYVNTSFLFDYNKEHHARSYYLDCDEVGIRFENQEDKANGEVGAVWQDFKDNYGLSEAKNEELGYGEGYVPSFIVYNKGDINDGAAALIKDMCVTFNDVLEEREGRYYISDTFYREDRLLSSEAFLALKEEGTPISLLNKEIPGSETLLTYNGAAYWKQKDAAKVELPYLNWFLDFYLK